MEIDWGERGGEEVGERKKRRRRKKKKKEGCVRDSVAEIYEKRMDGVEVNREGRYFSSLLFMVLWKKEGV